MQIKLLKQSIQQARADAEHAGEESRYILDELETPRMILQGHGPGGDLRKLLKQQQPSLLAWLLGPRTNVISVRVRHTHACSMQALPCSLKSLGDDFNHICGTFAAAAGACMLKQSTNETAWQLSTLRLISSGHLCSLQLATLYHQL